MSRRRDREAALVRLHDAMREHPDSPYVSVYIARGQAAAVYDLIVRDLTDSDDARSAADVRAGRARTFESGADAAAYLLDGQS